MPATIQQALTPPPRAWQPWRPAQLRFALGVALLVLLAGCVTAPFEPGDRAPTHAFDQPERSLLDRQLAPRLDAVPQASNLRLLVSGQDEGPEPAAQVADDEGRAQQRRSLQRLVAPVARVLFC